MTTDPLARLLDGLDPTTAELLERHLAPMRQRTGTNHAGYLTQWRTWLAGLDAAPALLEARERHVQAWVSAMLDSGAAATTVSAKMTSLRALYGRALREGLVAEDPTRWVRDPVRARRSTRLWLDDTQSVELLDAADAHADPALRAAIYLWLMVGCRPAEPLHCDVTHLGSYDGQTTLYLPQRKGGDASTVALSRLTGLAVHAAAGERTSGPLLLGPDGQRARLDPMRRAMRRLIREHTGLSRRLQPYGLRLTFATAALDAGVHERELAAYMGQRTTATIPVYDQTRGRVSIERAPTHAVEHRLGRDPETAAA